MITDPALHDYMVTANDSDPGRYKEAVEYLTERFNRPRELHSIYCKRLSEMQPIKGTPAELLILLMPLFLGSEEVDSHP